MPAKKTKATDIKVDRIKSLVLNEESYSLLDLFEVHPFPLLLDKIDPFIAPAHFYLSFGFKLSLYPDIYSELFNTMVD